MSQQHDHRVAESAKLSRRRYKTGLEYVVAEQMTTLGIGLIVIGVALVCGGLILWPRASQKDEDHADGTMADLLRRLNESSDSDP